MTQIESYLKTLNAISDQSYNEIGNLGSFDPKTLGLNDLIGIRDELKILFSRHRIFNEHVSKLWHMVCGELANRGFGQ